MPRGYPELLLLGAFLLACTSHGAPGAFAPRGNLLGFSWLHDEGVPGAFAPRGFPAGMYVAWGTRSFCSSGQLAWLYVNIYKAGCLPRWYLSFRSGLSCWQVCRLRHRSAIARGPQAWLMGRAAQRDTQQRLRRRLHSCGQHRGLSDQQ